MPSTRSPVIAMRPGASAFTRSTRRRTVSTFVSGEMCRSVICTIERPDIPGGSLFEHDLDPADPDLAVRVHPRPDGQHQPGAGHDRRLPARQRQGRRGRQKPRGQGKQRIGGQKKEEQQKERARPVNATVHSGPSTDRGSRRT